MNEWMLALFAFAAATSVVYAVASLIGGAGARRLRSRMESLADAEAEQASVSAIRARYLRQLSPFERRLEQLPGVATLGIFIEQAGWTVPAWRVASLSLGLAAAGGIVVFVLLHSPPLAILGALVAGSLPWLRAAAHRSERLEKFEGQLPDALDLMTRSLLAGNPLMESFRFVSEEMKPPISTEFGRAWSNANYGVALKACLADMLERNPSASLRSLGTAILVQRETGGNLAEILTKITGVMRARMRFQRRLKTLTAEGRMSGWVLGGMPFAMAGLLSITTPDYLPVLFHSPAGQKMVMGSGLLMIVGIIWISRVVKVKV